ncbi:MAG TPA: type I secretion system permease/ATPase, partial [Roseateles sp.]
MNTNATDLLRLLTRHAAAFGLFSAAVTALLLVPTVYMLQVYDRVLPSRNETTLLVLTGLALLLYGLMVALEGLRSVFCARLAARVDALVA